MWRGFSSMGCRFKCREDVFERVGKQLRNKTAIYGVSEMFWACPFINDFLYARQDE